MSFWEMLGDMFTGLWEESGLAQGDWSNYVMIAVSLVLMYLAIVKKFEPLLPPAHCVRHVYHQHSGCERSCMG